METMQQSPYISGLINLLFRCFLARPSRHSLRECPWACSHQTTTCVLGSLAPPIVLVSKPSSPWSPQRRVMHVWYKVGECKASRTNQTNEEEQE